MSTPSFSVSSIGGERADAFPSIDSLDRVDIPEAALLDQRIFGFRNADRRARPFKLLRSQVRRKAQELNARIIGVTSASPGIGKSFVAANLAAAVSRIADTDVYLIDVDLHRPALAGRFGLSERPGLGRYLNGSDVSLRDIGVRVNDERLAVIPTYHGSEAPAELLAGARASAFFASLRALPKNAFVILDMPPIFADDDVVIISRQLDGFIVVAEDGKTTSKQVQDVLRLLAPTPLIGTVLNRYKSPLLADEYGYGYGYGYDAYYGPKD